MMGQVLGRARNQRGFEADVQTLRLSPVQVKANLSALRVAPAAVSGPDGLFRLRVRAAIFGHNATNDVGGNLAPNVGGAVTAGRFALNAEYPELRPGSWLALVAPGKTSFITKVVSVDSVTASVGRISARATEVVINPVVPLDWALVSSRRVTVLTDSEMLTLAPLQITEPVTGSSLLLDACHPGLVAGRPVAVSGERDDPPGVRETEFHFIDDLEVEDGFTRLLLRSAIVGPFKRETVAVNANVARATHAKAAASRSATAMPRNPGSVSVCRSSR